MFCFEIRGDDSLPTPNAIYEKKLPNTKKKQNQKTMQSWTKLKIKKHKTTTK